MFQEALVRSGYDYKLEYKTATPKQKRSNKRKKDILWFNPPYNLNVMTNVGKEFFKLVDQCFPPGHPLRKIANRQVIKISYSTTPNMNKIIASANSNILTPEETHKNSISKFLCWVGLSNLTRYLPNKKTIKIIFN